MYNARSINYILLSIYFIDERCHPTVQRSWGEPVTTEWKFAHCWNILKDSPFIDYTPDVEKRDRIRQAECQNQ